jgi:hypothetical protein
LGTVGGSTYFYKQLEAIRLEQERMSNHLNKLTDRVASLEMNNNGRQESVAELNKQIKEVNQRMTEMPRLDTIFSDLDVIDRDLDDLVYDLQDRNIDVNRTSKESQSRRPGRRYVNQRESTDEVQKGRLDRSGRSNNQRPYSEPKTPLYQSPHHYQNYAQPGYPSPNYQPIYQPNTQPAPSHPVLQPSVQPSGQATLQAQPSLFDDGNDEDLINHVRTQHK